MNRKFHPLTILSGAADKPYANGKSSPPTPDYTGAAQATAAGNLDAARAQLSGSLINQYTPNGNLIYKQTGTDSYGNPRYSAYQVYSPEQQAVQNQQSQLNKGLLSTANQGLQYANDVLTHPGVDLNNLPKVGINPGQSYQDAMMSRLQPQIDRENQQSDAQLANQGIMQGSEAYNNAKTLLNQSHNDLLNNATVQGFNTGLAANQNSFNQQSYNQMQPINLINALRTGTQVQTPSYVNTPSQAYAPGADLLGATQAGYSSQLAQSNANNAGSAGLMNGLFSLGGAALMNPNMMKSW